MQINTSKSASKNLIDLINFDNGTALTSAEITLGTAAEWVDTEGTNDRNTQVEVSAVAGSGYTDSVFVRYYRLDLDVLRGARVLEYTKSESSTVQSAIDAFATEVDLIESELELVDSEGVLVESLPVLTEPTAFVLRAKSDSFTYIGECAVTLNPIPVTEEPIDQTVTEQDLSGFDEPA